MTDDGPAGSALSRWARRKAAARSAVAAAPPVPADDGAQQRDDAASPSEEAQQLANRKAAEAIDLASLGDNPDVTPFLKPGVPPALRQAALRQLYRLNPKLANLDGLVDYDDDFRSPSMTLSTFRSAWQAGRGYLNRPTDGTTAAHEAPPPADKSDPPPADGTAGTLTPARAVTPQAPAAGPPEPDTGAAAETPRRAGPASLRSRLGLSDGTGANGAPVPAASPSRGLGHAE